MGAVVIIIAGGVLFAYLLTRESPRYQPEKKVTIYGLDAAVDTTTAWPGIAVTLYGNSQKRITVEVRTPWESTRSETVYDSFEGQKTVNVSLGIASYANVYRGGDFKVTIYDGANVLYTKTFQFKASGFHIVSYSPRVLTSWSSKVTFTVTNDGDFYTHHGGAVSTCVENYYGGTGRVENWQTGVNCGVIKPGDPLSIKPGETVTFTVWFDPIVKEGLRESLDVVGRTREIWLLFINGPSKKVSFTFPSS